MPVTTSTSASLSRRALRAQRRAARQDETSVEQQKVQSGATTTAPAPPTAATARRSTKQGSSSSNSSNDSSVTTTTTSDISVSMGPQTRRRTRARQAAAAVVSSEKPPAGPKCEQQQAAAEEDVSPVPKRARSSSTTNTTSTTRRYNLRSTTTKAAAAAVATVSPGDIARQINFDYSSSSSSVQQQQQQDTTTTQQTLPPGVLDIYNPPSSLHCKCPSDISFYQDTRLATHHVLAYGAEFTQALLETERQQLIDLFGPRVVLNVYHDDDDNENAPITQTYHHNDVLYEYYGQDEADDLVSTHLRYRVRCIDEQEWNDPRTYLLHMHTLPRQPFITNKMRAVLVNWMVELGLEYSVSSQAYHLAVSLLDGILARGPTTQAEFEQYNGSSVVCSSSGGGGGGVVDSDSEDDEENEDSRRNKRWELVHRCDFQALGCACMLIAAKMEDHNPPTVEDLVYISDSSFTASKLRRLEQRVCRQLSFYLHRVTPMHYINQFLRASHACPCASCQYDHPVMRQMVLYLLELGRVSFDLSYRKPSLIAAAAVYLARVTLGLKECRSEAKLGQGYWTKTLQYTTGYSLEDLTNTVLLLHKYQCASERSRNNASFIKYKRASLQKVSLKTTPRIDLLGEEFGMELVHDEMTFENSEPDAV